MKIPLESDPLEVSALDDRSCGHDRRAPPFGYHVTQKEVLPGGHPGAFPWAREAASGSFRLTFLPKQHIPQRLQRLGDHIHGGQDRHEIGISLPAGDNMPMKMARQACPSSPS